MRTSAGAGGGATSDRRAGSPADQCSEACMGRGVGAGWWPLVLGVTGIGCAGCAERGGDRVSGGEVDAPAIDVAAADRAQRDAMARHANWADYGRDQTNQRWSPLAQITTANVDSLAPAWIHHSGIPHASETGPIVADGVMYFTTALNHVFAVDAETGRTRWEYAYDYQGRTVVDCCSTNNKGVALYGGRLFMATLDARLVAIDASNGKELWRVQVGDNDLGYHMTGAPIVVSGRVITGVSGGEQGCRCYVDAYDASTGRRLWRFYTIPSPDEGGWWGTWRTHDEWGMSFNRDIAKEKADSAKYADAWRHGGGPMWHHPAYDPALGLLFLNIGNAAPDNDGEVRPGDNLYTSSIVALDVKTGKLKWYYQEVSHDVWDYDATTPPVLVDVPDASGRTVHAVAEAGKDGFVYVLDRATGKPIRKSAPFTTLLNYMARPDTAHPQLVNPGTLGGSDWSPTAYSPQTGYLYVDANYLPMMYWTTHEELKPPAQWWGGTVAAQPTGTYGMVVAVDLATGRIAWQTRLAKPVISGLLATAGGLVFTGLSDKQVVALDARTGRELWRFHGDAGFNAPPISYEVHGVQYVAIAGTGIQTLNTPRGDEMVAFALPHAGPGGVGLPAVLGPEPDTTNLKLSPSAPAGAPPK
jgi:PQQ-dependent dehydrogenase (methanol/ethanol family)